MVSVIECGGIGSFGIADALADHQRADQRGDAGVDVHHRAAGEVDRAEAQKISAAIVASADRGSGRPRTRPCARSGSRRRSPRARRTGARAENLMRSAKAPTMSAGVMQAKVIWKTTKASSGMTTPAENVSTTRAGRHAGEEHLRQAADIAVQRAAVGEGEAVAVDHPDHHHEAGDGEDLHQHREHVLGAHEAAVEQRQAGDGHQQHERGRDRASRRCCRDRAPGSGRRPRCGGFCSRRGCVLREGRHDQGGQHGGRRKRSSCEAAHLVLHRSIAQRREPVSPALAAVRYKGRANPSEAAWPPGYAVHLHKISSG